MSFEDADEIGDVLGLSGIDGPGSEDIGGGGGGASGVGLAMGGVGAASGSATTSSNVSSGFLPVQASAAPPAAYVPVILMRGKVAPPDDYDNHDISKMMLYWSGEWMMADDDRVSFFFNGNISSV